jgi:hypothetical protein
MELVGPLQRKQQDGVDPPTGEMQLQPVFIGYRLRREEDHLQVVPG